MLRLLGGFSKAVMMNTLLAPVDCKYSPSGIDAERIGNLAYTLCNLSKAMQAPLIRTSDLNT